LMEEIYPILAGDEGLSDLKPLVQWMMACGFIANDHFDPVHCKAYTGSYVHCQLTRPI
jgi:hypothetical protein